MPSFAKNIKLCVSFAKFMKLCQVLPNLGNYAKKMELCEVLTKISNITNHKYQISQLDFQKQFLFSSFNKTYMVSPISPIYANVMASCTYTIIINALLGQVSTTIGFHQHQPWNCTIPNSIEQKPLCML